MRNVYVQSQGLLLFIQKLIEIQTEQLIYIARRDNERPSSYECFHLSSISSHSFRIERYFASGSLFSYCFSYT